MCMYFVLNHVLTSSVDVNQHASNKNIIKQCTFNLISKTH